MDLPGPAWSHGPGRAPGKTAQQSVEGRTIMNPSMTTEPGGSRVSKGARVQVLQSFAGPNVHLPQACLVASVDGRAITGGAAIVLPAAAARLLALLSGEITASRALVPLQRTQTLVRSGLPVPLDDLVGATSVELQRLNGEDVEGWHVLASSDGERICIAVGYAVQKVGRAALHAACDLIAACCASQSDAVALPTSVTGFLAMVRAQSLGYSSRLMVELAERRGIPWQRLNEGEPIDDLVELGEGHHRRRFYAAITEHTPLLGSIIADNKAMTAQMLRRIGLPAPRNFLVASADQAARAAGTLGYPVVIKPVSGANARGVSIGVASDDEAARAFELAAQSGRHVIVEEFIAGNDHRMLVIDGRLVATARRDPAQVMGDGRSTILELIEATNQAPERGTKSLNDLSHIVIDEAMQTLLAKSGRNWQSIPAMGEVVLLHLAANLSTGGTATDVSDTVHPDNRWMAETVAGMCGLDILGIDFLTPDITRPFWQVRGGINEINIKPGLRIHVGASGNTSDGVTPMFDRIAPVVSPLTIPTIAVFGTRGLAEAARSIADAIAKAGLHVVVSSQDGVTSGDMVLTRMAQCGDRAAAETILANPDAQAGVLTMHPDDIINSGMGWKRSDVAVVLDHDTAPPHHRALALLISTVAGAVVTTNEQGGALLAAKRAEGGPNVVVVCAHGPDSDHHLRMGRHVVVRAPDAEDQARLLPEGRTWPLQSGGTGNALLAAAVCLALDLAPAQHQETAS